MRVYNNYGIGSEEKGPIIKDYNYIREHKIGTKLPTEWNLDLPLNIFRGEKFRGEKYEILKTEAKH